MFEDLDVVGINIGVFANAGAVSVAMYPFPLLLGKPLHSSCGAY